MRVCTQCREIKDLEDFHKNKKESLGRMYYCKVCWKSRMRKQNNSYGIGVYSLVDKESGSIVYVGSGQLRARYHCHKQASGIIPFLHMLIERNGFERYEYRILEILESPKDLKGREQFYIDLYRPIANLKNAIKKERP